MKVRRHVYNGGEPQFFLPPTHYVHILVRIIVSPQMYLGRHVIPAENVSEDGKIWDSYIEDHIPHSSHCRLHTELSSIYVLYIQFEHKDKRQKLYTYYIARSLYVFTK